MIQCYKNVFFSILDESSEEEIENTSPNDNDYEFFVIKASSEKGNSKLNCA